MNRKVSLGVTIALMSLAAAVAIVITAGYSMFDFNGRMQSLRESEVMYSKLNEIDAYVRQNYYGEIDDEALMNAVAKGYVSGLGDAYAQYLTPQEYQQRMADYESQQATIGLSVVMDPSGYMKVVEVFAGSPAEEAGIEVGDLIVEVEGTMVTAENYNEMSTAMGGEEGTVLTLTVRRDNQDEEVEITRREVEVPMVTYTQYGDVGYIQIKEFHNNTPAQFDAALNALTSSGVQALIFDVRNNPGGTIDSVVDMLDTLLPEGTLVTATYKDGSTEELGYSDDDEVNLPMVVLTNEDTASAAELFAQAIKDFNKGRTVGTQTYGKGVMQTIYPLSDGGALSITTAKYNPPSGVNFDGVGVKPDYTVQLTAEQERNFYELDETTDPQLQKAIELAEAVIKTGGFDGPSEIPSDTETGESASDEEPSEESSSDESASEEEPSEESSSDESGSEESASDAESDGSSSEETEEESQAAA